MAVDESMNALVKIARPANSFNLDVFVIVHRLIEWEETNPQRNIAWIELGNEAARATASCHKS
tara:strand:- start:32892 stop:33080 length:189 start_codon:yes stop_codon:yes gene_type:complete